MNPYIDQFIESITKKLPDNELLTSYHLVSLGIAKSVSTLNRWRQQQSGPPFLRISMVETDQKEAAEVAMEVKGQREMEVVDKMVKRDK